LRKFGASGDLNVPDLDSSGKEKNTKKIFAGCQTTGQSAKKTATGGVSALARCVDCFPSPIAQLRQLPEVNWQSAKTIFADYRSLPPAAARAVSKDNLCRLPWPWQSAQISAVGNGDRSLFVLVIE
jgi:hypothetical protein